MELVFGKGDILVTECGTPELRHILFETHKGSGEVGARTLDPTRSAGATVGDDAMSGADCILTFNNPVSLAVVLEKVLSGMVQFRRADKTLGPEHAELADSIREAWAELTTNN